MSGRVFCVAAQSNGTLHANQVHHANGLFMLTGLTTLTGRHPLAAYVFPRYKDPMRQCFSIGLLLLCCEQVFRLCSDVTHRTHRHTYTLSRPVDLSSLLPLFLVRVSRCFYFEGSSHRKLLLFRELGRCEKVG